MGRFMFAVLSGIGRERQFDTEKRTMTERAEGGNLALVCRANRFHNGESKTGTAEFPGPCFVDTEKTLENPGQRIGWNARPIVSNLEDGLSVAGGYGEHYGTLGECVFNCVIEKVHHDL